MKRHIFLLVSVIATAFTIAISMDKDRLCIINKNELPFLEDRYPEPHEREDTRYELKIDNKTLLLLIIEADHYQSPDKKIPFHEFLAKLKKYTINIPSCDSGITFITSRDMHYRLLPNIRVVGDFVVTHSPWYRLCSPVMMGNQMAYLYHTFVNSDKEHVTHLTDFSKSSKAITSAKFDECKKRVEEIVKTYRND